MHEQEFLIPVANTALAIATIIPSTLRDYAEVSKSATDRSGKLHLSTSFSHHVGLLAALGLLL